MMKAIRVLKFGSPKVLTLQSVELPKITNSTVLVQIAAAGVNPVDTYIREGAFATLPDLPYTPGKDGSGVVHAVGENVTKVKVGQRVFVCSRRTGQYGTYAEYSLVPEDDVFPLDDKLSFEDGAALGVAYFTAYRALMLKAKCMAGETVLIHGASGAVGLACVQLAKKQGLKVIGTAGTQEGMDLVQDEGADIVVNHKAKGYEQEILEKNGNKGADIIIEMLANINLDKDFDLLGPRGRIAIVGSRGSIKIDPRKMMGRELQVVGVALLNSTHDEWNLISQGVLDGIKDGWVKPVIEKKYSLEECAAAHEDVINKKSSKG
ncbi:Quinone oxidoreductase, partial [Stegodyphus mimosarum]